MGVPCVRIFVRTTGEADWALAPSPDRPFTVDGLDPDQRPIRPRHFADGETARHVAQVLRAFGYTVSVTQALAAEAWDQCQVTEGGLCLGRRTTTGGARRG